MNELISMLSLIEQCITITQPLNRQPISQSSLQTIKSMFAMATNLLSKHIVNGTLLANAASIDALLKGFVDTGMTETDALAKDTLVGALQDHYNNLLVEVAKYYCTHEFQHYPNLDPILTKLVKAGLDAGLSFKEGE